MEQVYWLTNTFIDLIIRDQVLPATINISTELDAKIAQLIPSWPSAWTARTSSPGSAWPTSP